MHCLGHWVALNPRSVGRVIDDIRHEDLKDALRSLNARLVELDDRLPADNEAARDSLTGAWRAYNALARRRRKAAGLSMPDRTSRGSGACRDAGCETRH